jgi:hypothetical protein
LAVSFQRTSLWTPVSGRLSRHVARSRNWRADPFLMNPRTWLARALKPADAKDIVAHGDETRPKDHGKLWTPVRPGVQCQRREVPRTDGVACQLAFQHPTRMHLARAHFHTAMVGEFDAGPHGNCIKIQYSSDLPRRSLHAVALPDLRTLCPSRNHAIAVPEPTRPSVAAHIAVFPLAP